MNRVVAILCSDFHLREDTPICRTDDFWKAQWKKVQFIKDLQREHNVPTIHAGDLFNNWKPSPLLLSMAIEYLPAGFHSIYGNHDLPQHNIELAHKCGINTLVKAGKVELLRGIHWNNKFEDISILLESGIRMLVWHIITYSGRSPYPGCTDPSATALLRRYPKYNLIVTGHNHQSFVVEYEGRLLVNPGSITRHDADQQDFKPRVYLLYENNTVEPVYLPIEQGVISREHLERNEQRNERIEAFISRLTGEWETGVSFEENLERFFQANEVKDSVKQIIYKAIEI
jgi:DNA repair exonuclease SbcCD nuclease subunit